MTDEKNGVKIGEANNTEMAPQEDGTKVPLTNSAGAEAEVKFTAGTNPPNGEAKVDMGTVPTFSGLTKDELMKYSDDPFWVRLRWFLFILFWAAWLAMLVVAIVIIVQAPRCAPKETLEWVQESAMIDYDLFKQEDIDNSGGVDPADMVKMATELGLTTVYMKNLISPFNFEKINPEYKESDITPILSAAKDGGLKVVTDFVPIRVDDENIWFNNPNLTNYFKPNSNELDFTNVGLLEALKDLFSNIWIKDGVQGFMMATADTEELQHAKDYLNSALEGEDGAVVSGITDMKDELVSGFNAEMYRSFLDQHVNDWSYFKYNPKVAQGTIPDLVHLVTMTLFLVPGTPILDGFDKAYLDSEKETISSLSLLREKESVKVGNFTFVSSPSTDVVAFVRLLKGTPGYAVAVNMHEFNSTQVNFSSIEGVPAKGEVHLTSSLNGTISGSSTTEKKDLASIDLGPLEGIILQFVPSF